MLSVPTRNVPQRRTIYHIICIYIYTIRLCTIYIYMYTIRLCTIYIYIHSDYLPYIYMIFYYTIIILYTRLMMLCTTLYKQKNRPVQAGEGPLSDCSLPNFGATSDGHVADLWRLGWKNPGIPEELPTKIRIYRGL